MALYISTGDGVVGYVAVDLYLGRCGRVWCCRSLLGTMLKRMTLYISTWDGMVGYGAVCITGDGVIDYRNADLNWERCGWEWGNRSLLRTQLWGMVL